MTTRILYTDDDMDACHVVGELLRGRGFEVVTETDSSKAVELGRDPKFDIILTDLRMNGLDGLAVCERLIGARPGLPVIVVTGDTSLGAAVSALRAGAFDFVTKPVDPELLVAALRRAGLTVDLRAEIARLETVAGTGRVAGDELGDSGPMRRVFDTVGRVARTDATVLVTGESGTGKELIARLLHDQSRRAAGPFIAINCAAMPAPLLESELFGHAKGAFTDAKSERRGLLLEANGGTLFLDEIGDMPLEMQVKLLRSLQERTVRHVGGQGELPFDARIVAATNRDLEADVVSGRFREALYYRVNVCSIELPPLRDREGDVAVLAERFVTRFAQRHQKAVTGIELDALRKLTAYRWPGNVRELENCVERAVAMTRTEKIVVDDLPDRIRAYRPEISGDGLPLDVDALVTIEALEARYIDHVMRLVSGNRSRAARLLGVDRRTLYRKLGAREHMPPGAPREPSSVPPPRTPAVSPAPGATRVLLVDANHEDRELMRALLAGQGFIVTGVDRADSSPDADFDVVVLTDLPLDAEALHDRTGAPVVVVTGSSDTPRDTPGVGAVLLKPVRVDALAGAVRRLAQA